MAKLTLAFKDKKLKIFPILSAELIVGRDPDCAIHIDSLAVQPRHARIFADGTYYCVEGLQSDEPLLVNQKPLAAAATLQDGDLIQVGKHTLSFSSEPAKEGVQVNHAPMGRTIRLDRSMTRLGKTGKESAIISRREDGYHIAHLEGDAPPRVNDVSIGDSSQLLRDGDRMHIGNLELHFYTDGGAPAAAETEAMQEEQRRFTRIPFDAAAVLTKDGHTWPCELIDLSLKGALVGQPDNWNGHADEDYQLTLTLDDDVRIQMDVSIAHIENKHVGLYCKDIDLDSITHLRRLVELNLGDSNLLERELMALG
ncbi:MAG: FHA domain-containing protein [Gammaproteobacteria bacterium]|nr:FHA domain-containing protein [Gammaproteobacteria bacterium]